MKDPRDQSSGAEGAGRPAVTSLHVTGRGAVLAAVLGILMLSLAGATPARALGCPNEQVRSEQGPAGLALPTCRAYELVSPGSTPVVGNDVSPSFGVRAAGDGDAIAYFSYYPALGAPSSGFPYRSRRGLAGWALEAMSPQLLPGAAPKVSCESAELNYSVNLLASVLRIGREIKEEFPGSSFCGQPQEEVVAGEPSGFGNLLRRATAGSPYELVNVAPLTASPANAQFQDASEDLSHIVFGEKSQLTPEAPPGYNLYLWVGGRLHLLSFLPDGTSTRGDLAGATAHPVGAAGKEGGTFNGTAPITNAVSSDGERVFFYADGALYLRENAGQVAAANPNCLISEVSEPGRACTLQIDASRGIDPSGGGMFQYASSGGSRVFFTDERRLTFPSSAAAGKPALYEYDVATHTLADRTIGATSAAAVRGFSGASEDGSRLYFVANSALTGAQANGNGEVAQSGSPNLYLLEAGTPTFIATLDPAAESDRSAWSYELTTTGEGAPTAGGGAQLATRTSPDGRFFAFNSIRGLTGGPAGTSQIFIYDAVTHALSCASCLPGGGPPSGPSALPAPIATTEGQAPAYLPRGLTDGGALFFTTSQGLLPTDGNQVPDVYEYRQGALSLISDGTGAGPSYFFDASVGAGNVFFATTDPLVRADTDNTLNLYDARVGGGFPEPPQPPPPCAGAESCHGEAANAPSSGGPATANHAGSGNVSPVKRCRRHRVRHHGRCVKKVRRHHRHHHRHHHHRRHRKKRHSGKTRTHGGRKGTHR